MLESTLNATVPLASVLIGAGLTYWLNIRGRRRSLVEDLFNQAITAVAVADASQHYIRDVAKPQALDTEGYQEMRRQLARTAIENHTRAAGEARAALARILQYEPAVRPYYIDATAVTNRPDEIVSFLIAARRRAIPNRRWHRLRPRKASDKASGTNIADGDGRRLDPPTIRPFGVDLMVQVSPRPVGYLGTSYGDDADHFAYDDSD